MARRRRWRFLGAGVAAAAAATGLVLALLTGPAGAEPQARFAVAPGRPSVGETVRFIALVNCGRRNTVCSWDFGDGSGGQGQGVQHAYDSPGSKTVTLTVDDGDPQEPPTSASGTVDVQGAPDPTPTPTPTPAPTPPPNRDPTADIRASATQVRPGQSVSFDARATDPDGDSLSYAWDFGDNSGGSGQTSSHAFGAVGDYRVRLTVSDGNGGRASDNVTIRVRSVNAAPTVSIAASSTTPATQEPVTLTAQAADSDGSVTAYAWDTDGDNQFDDGTTNPISVAYPLPGDRDVRVRVTDDAGARTTSAATTLSVQNRRPTVVFDYDPKFIPQGGSATFTSRSSDPEGRMDTQTWDLDGDGQFDDATGATARATFPGTRPVSVGLRVTDKDGAAADRRVQIVPGNRAPTATIAVAPDPPQPGAPATLTATAEDDDGTVDSLAWDLDDDGEFDDGDGQSVTWTFATAGPQRVALQATDNSGSATVVVRELNVGGAAAPVAAGGAPQRLLLMRPFPVVRVAGRLTRRGARLRLVAVTARRGARIVVRCRGRGCASKRVVTKARGAKKAKRLRRFQRSYAAGARLEIRVTSGRRIGKYTRIRIRRGKSPARVDRCVMPGSRAPQACPG